MVSFCMHNPVGPPVALAVFGIAYSLLVYRARPSSFALAREKGLAKVAVGMQLIKMAEEFPRARRTRDACACSSLSRNVRVYTALRAHPRGQRCVHSEL